MTARDSWIAEENGRQGTSEWWPARHAPAGAVEAYTRQVSVRTGERVELCVSTRPAARYRTRVFRLGWYGGSGARLVHEEAPAVGIARDEPPLDPASGLCRADWPTTDSLYVSEDWTPGHYAAQLTLVSGDHAGSSALVPFVVRRPPDRPPALLVQTGVNTCQAYNHWGGKSLYPSNSTDRRAAVKVSFDRPVPDWDHANLNARAPFHYDLAVIRFLEREGYDAGYQTDVDTHREPWTVMTAAAIVCAAHDEYWTFEMRRAFEHAQAAGIHLAFLGANQCYWQIRYEDQERTLVEYRSSRQDPIKDPGRKTVRWRDLELARPESRLLGVQYDGGITSTDELLTYEVVPGAASDPWGAALADAVPLAELVGYEWDALDPDFEPPGLVRFLHCADERSNADCVRWRAPSGAHVFAAGSLALAHGLDDWARPGLADERARSLVRNALNEMLG
jgi:hypothetical protein